MKGIVADDLKTGFPPALVEASKRREVADAEFRKNSVEGLAAAWSQALAVEGRNSPDDDIESIRKVTVADVNRVAREYLVNETATTAILTPRPSGAPVSENGFGGRGVSFAPERASCRLPAWAKKLVTTTPALPASRVKPTDILLANGLRLIVRAETMPKLDGPPCPQDPEQPRPTGTGGRGGNRSGPEPSLPVWNGHSGSARLPGGAGQYRRDHIGRNEFFAPGSDGGIDQGVRLLAENLLHPTLPEDAFRIVRRQVSNAVAGDIKSPDYLSRRALRTGLYPKGDPELRQATPTTVADLRSRASVRTTTRFFGRT